MEHLYKSIVCAHCGELIRVPVYCKNRFCEVCGPARQFRVREKIKHLLKCADFSSGYFLGMVTVSLPNTKELLPGVEALVRSFSRLRRSALWKRSIRGGVYVIEITGKPGSWHPHIHALVEQKFISWKAFHARWNALTGASAFHVKRIPTGAAERYLTKYLTKPPGSPERVLQIATDLRHTRLFQPFGTWHGKIGSWTKLPYPCPECGNTCWEPFEEFIQSVKARPVVQRGPPVGKTDSIQPEKTPRPVVNQAVLGGVIAAAVVPQGMSGRQYWDPNGRI